MKCKQISVTDHVNKRSDFVASIEAQHDGITWIIGFYIANPPKTLKGMYKWHT